MKKSELTHIIVTAREFAKVMGTSLRFARRLMKRTSNLTTIPGLITTKGRSRAVDLTLFMKRYGVPRPRPRRAA